MADEIDDILGPEKPASGGDDIDAILGEAPPEVSGLAGPRRVGRMEAPSFRKSDDELDLETPAPYGGRQILAPLPIFTQKPEVVPGVTRPFDPMEADPIAQGVATSTVLGPIGRTISAALPRAAAPAVAAGEGALASKSMGGSALTGGALGGAFGLLGVAAKAATPAAAAGRAEARLAKDVNRGVTKAGARAANDVKFKAGEGNADLAQVADELPEVGKALKTQAKTNPKAAHKVTAKAVDDLTDANDADFARIQRQHGGVPLQPIAERMAGLEERLNQQGLGVAADAVQRMRTDLLKRYGSGPEGLATAKLTAQQIRNIRNNLSTVMDPARAIKPNTRRAAEAKIHQLLNKEIEDVAADTRGVDVDALRARNRQISTLIPVRNALAERAEKLTDRDISIVGLAKETAKNAPKRLAREIDYRLSRIPLGGELAEPNLPASVPAAATQARERGYASRVAAAMASGMPLAAAVAAAEAD